MSDYVTPVVSGAQREYIEYEYNFGLIIDSLMPFQPGHSTMRQMQEIFPYGLCPTSFDCQAFSWLRVDLRSLLEKTRRRS